MGTYFPSLEAQYINYTVRPNPKSKALLKKNRTLRGAVAKIYLLGICSCGMLTVNKQGCFGRGVFNTRAALP